MGPEMPILFYLAGMRMLVFLMVLASGHLRAQVFENAEEAFQSSTRSQKPILLVFSGSDWCAPCIRFQKTVLSDAGFQHYAADHLILLKADFPQRKKLDQWLIGQNERLAETYNPRGQFPHIVLLRPDRTLLATLTFKDQRPEEFISQLSLYFAE